MTASNNRYPTIQVRCAVILIVAASVLCALPAQASGFGIAEHLATLLKATTGLTPLKYRSRIRGR